METFLLVLGGVVEGYDFSPGPELIGPAGGDEVGRSFGDGQDGRGRVSVCLHGCITSRFRASLQLPLGNPITRVGGLRRQMCLLWSSVLIG